MSTEPLRLYLLPTALLAFAASAQAWIDGETTRGVVAAALGALIVAATEGARRLVTPTVKLPQGRVAPVPQGSTHRGPGKYGS